MSAEVDESIGARIRRARRRAGMTQDQLAARAGVSTSTIQSIEQGARHPSTARLSDIATALDVTRGWLLDGTVQLTGDGPNTGALAIRAALTSVDDLIGDERGVEPFDPAGLEDAVSWVAGGYASARYQALSEFLPSAIARTKAAVRQAAGDERPRVLDAAARLLGLAGSTLVHLGYPDVSLAAMREAIRLAEESGRPMRVAVLKGTLAWALLTQGRYSDAHRLAVATARQAEPVGSIEQDKVAWALHGSLLLTAATSIARAGDRSAAHALLADASRIAQDTGRVAAWDDAWGPEGVLMQRVDVELVTEEYGAALDLAGRMPADADLPLVSRCRHLSDVALAQTRADRTEDALGSLLLLERTSEEYLRVQDQPRATVQELRSLAGWPRELAGLAERAGLLTSRN